MHERWYNELPCSHPLASRSPWTHGRGHVSTSLPSPPPLLKSSEANTWHHIILTVKQLTFFFKHKLCHFSKSFQFTKHKTQTLSYGITRTLGWSLPQTHSLDPGLLPLPEHAATWSPQGYLTCLPQPGSSSTGHPHSLTSFTFFNSHLLCDPSPTPYLGHNRDSTDM